MPLDPAGEVDETATPHYDGEDTRPTSQAELRGFYMYGWAAEVFVVCGMGSFIPITLEQLARERGVLQSDHSTPCKSGLEVSDPYVFNKPPPSDAVQCVVDVLGMEINTASFAMYTFSLSVLVQALLIISMSGVADHGAHRKTLLLTFAFTGAVAMMLFLPIGPQLILLGALLAIVANTCFGASFVLLNSFLPLLVRHHPTILEKADWEEQEYDGAFAADSDIIADATTALLPGSRKPSIIPETLTSDELRLSTGISSYGMGISYIGALILQISAIATVRLMDSTLFSLRLVLFMIGAWWLVFTVPAGFWLRARPGPPLHLDPTQGRLAWGWAYFKFSWGSLGRSAMHARRLKDCLLFLGAWFLLSDAIATVSGTAILFAKTSLEMQPAALAMITVTATLSGIVGAFSWSKLSAMMGLKPSQTILACICLFEVIPIYGLLGYVPAIRRLGVFGLQQPWEMYPLGAIYGFVMGGLSSFCRSLFGELIPPGFEAAFYALYAITDKGSSVFGPAIVGAITDATGEIRPAFWFLAVLIALPFPLMLLVDVDRGRREGVALAKELEDRTGVDSTPEGPIVMVDEEEDNW
ncbi:autophagy-related protein 22-1 [Trichodelitschia bisporula]|uniref:Autophagy-related protein n=1 Tax=Trichodelitschia bisporula TaxID=703511 RepID=A0A6G1HVM7_9PEZI|nr:autophagy-related protein 22-1 [Trichodelitschia bisporula]